MKFAMTPLSIGEILGRALSLFSSRLLMFVTIELIAVTPTLVLQLALPDIAIGPLGALLSLPMLFLGPIGSAAMLHVIAQEYLGQPVGLGEALKFALGKFLPLLGTSLLGGLGIAFGVMLCCIPGIYLGVIWAFTSQVVVMENLAGPSALGRSKNLVEGFFWHVFVVLFLVGLCVGMTSGVINVILSGVLPYQEVIPGNPNNPMPTFRLTNYGNFAVFIVTATVINGLGQAFTAVSTTIMYFDLRNRKEAFDVGHIVAWMDQYRTWRDEPVPDLGTPSGPTAAPETGIKQPGDVVPPPLPPETGIQDPTSPRPDSPPPP